MADQTSSSIIVDAPPADVMDVIADFESYPEWAKGVQTAEVRAEGHGDRAEQVYFALDVSPIKDQYTLAYDWKPSGVSWELVGKSTVQKSQKGSYSLAPKGDGTEVTYHLAVDIAMPMLGMFKRKAEKMIMDSALKELKKRVEST